MEIIPTKLPKRITDLYNTSRNTFIEKNKGKENNESEIEIGDIKQDDFFPQIKLKRWDNECNASFRLINDEKEKPQIITKDNKIKFIKKKIEAHFYDCKTNAYEFEVILKEKPETNKVRMSIKTKGLRFYYQPSLNEERHDKRVVKVSKTNCYDKNGKVICHRSENVIGSYAVYHESKKGDYSQMGGKNYKAGKAFHIFRPKIIDSAGNWVWGKLNIDTSNDTGLLTIEIPKEFLNAAVYPVIVDPTFGHTSAGVSWQCILGDIRGALFSGVYGVGISMHVNITSWDEEQPHSTCSIYIHNGSSLNLLSNGQTEIKKFLSGRNWNTFSFSTSPILSTADDYVLVVGTDDDADGNIWYDSGDNDQGHYDWAGYESPLPSPNFFSHNNCKYSIYCTYNTSVQKSVSDSNLQNITNF